MEQLTQEVEENRTKINKLNEQVEGCTKQTTMARTAITTLSSKQQTLDASSKSLKGADLTKVKGAIEKIDSELEGARNQLSVSESTCTNLKEEITKVTSVVVQYNQEFKYYQQIRATVKKDIDEAEKNEIKVEEEKEEEKKEEKEEKDEEKKDEKKEKPKKEKPTKSSTSNEVKQIETQEETTVAVTKILEKELEETDQKITDTTEEIVK
jgi:chromosome segregation ATPase